MSGSGAPGGLPLDATVTIVNNSGKIISTGKQLLSIWKTAQASYREKKTELNQERAAERSRPPPVPVKRAQTFDTSRGIGAPPRRQYDELSIASSHRTFKSSIAKKQLPPVPNQLALTEGNLEKLSEVSSAVAYEGAVAAPAAAVPRLEEPVDEAIVLETVEVDISGIDTWRRGIVDWGYESADQELMTPEADRVTRERRASKGGPPEDYFDSKSRRSSKTAHRSSKGHSSSSSSSHKSHKSRHESSSSSDKKSSSSSSSKKDREKGDDASSINSMSLIKKSIASRKKAIDESGVKSEELPLRAKMRQTNMLKALFKSKEHRQTLVT
ncbi:hypothetical protein M440DRAFT_1395358 [Trichoderma longibrachiatum ATCC 18648]|uniref:Uncharacterized protein n=1 Tax=Trichoderma longibrachiatum ATCC 18648 TaxID=983965 RepID=A0A2T4BRE9_TRILO|nr:hypothetical protein M440DRAFT_1395358 [Trichoderma longibrachiatum ATCC 18648]